MPSDPHRPETIFASALAIADAAERAAYLDRTCAGDAQLRHEVESLLAADARAEAGEFLAQPPTVVANHPALATNGPREEQSGDRLGRYKLLEVIGEGGFGVVWMAEQVEPVRRPVGLLR